MTTMPDSWSESDSELYQDIAAVAVPARAEQMAALLTLLPFKPDETFRVVELGCGEGLLAQTLLACFAGAELVALDGSAVMRERAAERLTTFGPRVRIEPFDLASTAWLPHLQGADGVISSLCLHHLNAEEKQALFGAIQERLSPWGVFLIADLIEPQRPEARTLFAATWDRITKAQSLAQTGSTASFERFIQTEWNHYRFPDPVDQPSPLFDQLTWLKAAGFAVVDCFWLKAGHAIYGGYKSRSGSTGTLSFTVALQAAQIQNSTKPYNKPAGNRKS